MKKLILFLIPFLFIACAKDAIIVETNEPEKTNEDVKQKQTTKSSTDEEESIDSLKNKRNSATDWDTDNIRFCCNEEDISNSNYVGSAFQKTYGIGGIIGTFENESASYSFYENGEYRFEYNGVVYTGNYQLRRVSSYQTITISGNRQFYYVDGDYLILVGNMLEDFQYIENQIPYYKNAPLFLPEESNAVATKYDLSKKYDLASAYKMVQDMNFSNVDETVEAHVSVRLEKNATVRDTLVFPNQFGGYKKVLVFCKEDKVQEALDAGAAFAGSDEYIELVKGGWLDFDVCVATPDMMKEVGRLGMVLGRKGIMPNPKTGTVTPNVGQAVAELRKGRTEYRADETGIVHISVAKCSMETDKTAANINTLLAEINKKKPEDAADGFISSVSISSSLCPGVLVDYKEDE